MFTGITKTIMAFIATAGLITFIVGLAYSISVGFAGFWGGLPFWIIAVSVLLMVVYDFYDECVKKK